MIEGGMTELGLALSSRIFLSSPAEPLFGSGPEDKGAAGYRYLDIVFDIVFKVTWP